MTDASTAEADLAKYHARREEGVVLQTGPLALVNTQWVDAEQSIWGVRGSWLPDPEGLRVVAAPEDNIVVDGKLVDGEVLARAKNQSEPSSIVFDGTRIGTVIANSEGGHALRVWDSESDAIKEFGSIGIFPYNPDWVITATWTENPAGTTMGFEHLKDEGSTREEVIPGDISFTKDGVEYHLAAFKAGRALQLVFADATSNVDTYGVGRFLYLAPNADGTITLDFNRAVLPPCAFSYNFNCPLPPKQNRFAVRIEAGETNVLKKDGSLLHD
jgi:uncharacterized protein (DUF1684 family)